MSNWFKGLIISVMWAAGLVANAEPTVNIATYNLKWFGLSGQMWNDLEAGEFRETYLKRFINEELSDVDVFVFTEVVKTDLLFQLMAPRWQCVSYDGAWDRHQHIVACFKGDQFRAEPYDSDYIIQEVDMGSAGLRPALQTKICWRMGSCILQLIGVHLKAGPETEERKNQVQLIADVLSQQRRPLPTVILGDFNSYTAQQSGLPQNDMDYFEQILSNNQQRFRSVTEHIPTYGSGAWGKAYDQIVVSDDLRTLAARGYQACQAAPDFTQQFVPYPSYRKYFSDHCPVVAKVMLP